MDHDQLASKKPADLDPHSFQRIYVYPGSADIRLKVHALVLTQITI